MLYHIVTYGCQMNLHESEKVAGMLKDRGYSETADLESADFILFNTCCIREGAENRALGNIGAVKRIKAKKPSLVVAVIGCMPQQEGVAKKICNKFPFVDIVLGTHNVVTLGEKLDEVLRDRVRCSEILECDVEDMDAAPVVRTSGLNAWVNIMYGCNNFCTYCIVPYVRGREHSRSPQQVENEVAKAISDGFKEVTLLGQNVNSYAGEGGFSALLNRLAQLDGDFRIKYMTSHPKDFDVDIALAMKNNLKVADYLHLPVQSGSSKILSAMNRHYTREDYLNKIDMVRSLIPNVGLSTDIMVGFPGETDADFDDTMDLVRRVRYDNMFTFVYSRRSGTVADKMDCQVPQSVKDKRIHALVQENRKIATEKAAECVGLRYRALAESKDGILTATTDCGRFVTIPDGDLRLHGRLIQVEVTAHRASKLIAKVLD